MKRRVWIPLLILGLWVSVRSLVVGAAPAFAPSPGITVTPTPLVLTPTPTPLPSSLSPCDPIVRKQVSPGVAQPGDDVVFTITVVNDGQEAAVDAWIQDRVPGGLEILEVEVTPADQGQERLPRNDQLVLVDLGTLGQDFMVTVVIHARVREDAPSPACIENVVEFRAPNCPDRSAEVVCWQLPEAGGPGMQWMVAAGLAAGALALCLALNAKRRGAWNH